MEFTTLTRRVAEFAGIDAGADRAGCEAGVGADQPTAPAAAPGRSSSRRPAAHRRRHDGQAAPGSGGAGDRRSRRSRSPPRALRSGARRQDRPLAIRDRAHARPAQSLDRARLRRRRRRDRHRDDQPRSDAGARCAASRSRSRRTRPATCRSATARAATAAARPVRAAKLCAGPDLRKRDALAALKPLLEDRGVLKIGAEPEIRLAGVRAARHRDRSATTTPC